MENIKSGRGDICLLLKVSRGKTHRVISVIGKMTLYQLARAITEAYNFYFDHCFGFYDNLKKWPVSKEQYELFKDMGEESDAESVKKTKVQSVFDKAGKKMLFFFDYGDNWEFIVELKGASPAEEGRYPKVIESVGKSPEQYK